jgi:putative nucleotidyltransferase with HDIG domain/PAS domain S-box-containing protein
MNGQDTRDNLLNVLSVEDSPRDFELIREKLTDAGYDLRMDRVETEKELVLALKNHAYDVILVDFKLPAFDAFTALRLAAEICPGVPVVCVSGTIGEETAIDLIKRGAVDYVLKDRPERLPLAVRRALVEAKEKAARQRAEAMLRFNNVLLRTQQESSIDGIMVVDDNGSILSFNRRFMEMWDIPPDVMESKSHARILELMADRLARPEQSASEEERLFQARDEASREELILKDGRTFDRYSAPMLDADGKNYGRVWYFRDISPRKHAEENISRMMKKLKKSLMATINIIMLTVETRDPYTSGHQKKVSSLAGSIAQEMGLWKDVVENIGLAGDIHDIGKMSVPAEILSKPSRLTDIEMSLIKNHAQAGYNILKDAGLPYPIAEIVLQHHERLDGSGYPRGLKGGEILLEAQIVSVADAVEAIASHRPYRPALGIKAALEELEGNKGALYNAKAAEVCRRLFMEKGYSLDLTES